MRSRSGGSSKPFLSSASGLRRLAPFLASLLVLAWTAAALARADQVAVKELLAEPDKWHGRAVVVSGTVLGLDARVSQKGNPYYTFRLNDGAASVTVFAYGTPAVKDGSRVQVEGTFLKVKRVGKHTFQNQVDAARITPL